MTIEEKLKHFENVCSGDAQQKYDAMISEYTASLEKLLTEHKEQASHQADLRVQAESEKIKRDMNRQLSVEQIRIKRVYSQKQEELKCKIFNELRDRLAQFMESSSYVKLLEVQIEKAMEFAGKAEVYVLLDPGDGGKQNLLGLRTGCEIRISDTSFMGGTKAVIASKNVLIDNSFETMLREAEESFQFVLGGK